MSITPDRRAASYQPPVASKATSADWRREQIERIAADPVIRSGLPAVRCCLPGTLKTMGERLREAAELVELRRSWWG
ncbi:hypothetical protein GCM10023176_62010 [Micromonospora coerulea]|uniref:Uncharacterized protein n=1 Tax=Micromonospora coerulea TaxID=47856 RepID=A0ABP8T6H1_9ACTN